MHRLTAVTALAMLTTAAGAAECPVERAVYALRSQPEVTAGFVPARNMASGYSDLYAFVTTAQRTYWFSLTGSNGYSNIYLLPITDPYHPADPDAGPQPLPSDDETGLALYAMDADLAIAVDAPLKADPAPAHLFIPDLGPRLWYDPQSLTTDSSAERDSIDRALFSVVECLETARPEAYP